MPPHLVQPLKPMHMPHHTTCAKPSFVHMTPPARTQTHLAAGAHAAPGAAAQGRAVGVGAGGAGGREEGGHALGIRLHAIVAVHARDLRPLQRFVAVR